MASPLLHPIDWFRARHWRITRRISNVDRYELDSGNIVHHRGWFTTERIPISRITAWRIEYEMVFDIVLIDVQGMASLVWFDYDNDLLEILRTQVSDRAVWDDS